MKIRYKLYSAHAFLIVSLLCMVIEVFTLKNIYNKNLNEILLSNEKNLKLYKFNMMLEHLIMPANDYLISGNKKEKEGFIVESEQIWIWFQNNEMLFPSNQKMYNEIGLELKSIIALGNKILQSGPSNLSKPQNTKLMYEMDHKAYKIHDIIKIYIDIEMKKQGQLSLNITKTATLINTIIYLTISGIMLLGAIFVIFLNKSINQPIEKLTRAFKGVSQGRWSNVNLNKRTGELRTLAVEFNNMVEKLREFYDEMDSKVNDRTKKLNKLNAQLRTLAITDGLTGLHNNRYFYEMLKLKFEQVSKKKNGKLALFMIDIDNFKFYNDKFGHPAGDQLLHKLSHILKKMCRKSDIVSRYGGEEFAIIISDITPKRALQIAEEIRQKIESSKFPFYEQVPGNKITVSIGLAHYNSAYKEGKKLVKDADTALYKSKNRGKNCTTVFNDGMKN